MRIRAPFIAGRLLVLTLLLSLLAVSPFDDSQAQRPDPAPADPARAQNAPPPQPEPTNRWIVELTPGQIPQAVAASLNMFYVGPVANMPNFHIFEAPGVNARDAFAAGSVTSRLANTPGIRLAVQDMIAPRDLRSVVPQARAVTPTDPLFPDQWHLSQIKVQQAWDWGFTGGNSRIGIVDEGMEYTHSDLWPNYLSTGYDYYSDDADPFSDGTERHATSAAGIAAAAADGAECGVGVAPNAWLVPVRLLGPLGPTTSQEAAALGHGVANFRLDVSNNSWGPSDGGQVLGGVTSLQLEALRQGALFGRGSRGMVYVWAGGNGYNNGDHSGADSFVNSRYTIPVAALGQDGRYADYSEQGAGLIVSAPADPITTTDRTDALGYDPSNCTSTFNGTSAAAPVVSGVVAMMLQASPNLTWRDVQAILIRTAQQNDFDPGNPGATGWIQNGAGLWINHNYGFGMVDAEAAVGAATAWELLGPEFVYDSGTLAGAAIPDNNTLIRSFNVPVSMNIESVIVRVKGTHQRRGQLSFRLISPEGTTSILLQSRFADAGTAFPDPIYGHEYYELRSMRHYGEDAAGLWTLQVVDSATGNTGTLTSWGLTIYGTSPYSTDLLQDGGFEQTLDGKTPLLWTQWGTGGGNHILKAKPMRGTWALRFFGGTPPVDRIFAQSAVGDFKAGDILWFGGWARGVNLPNGGRLVIKIQYADGTSGSFWVRFNQGTYWWQPHSLAVTLAKDAVSTSFFARYINATTPSERMFVDEVFLRHVRSPASMAPLSRGTGDLPAPLDLPEAAPLDLPEAPVRVPDVPAGAPESPVTVTPEPPLDAPQSPDNQPES
jgi:kexin